MKKIIISLLIIWAAALSAQENLQYFTYGPAADRREGDDDFRQTVFLKIPETAPDIIKLMLFDPECSGSGDTKFGGYIWDTHTLFRLSGGEGVYSGYDPLVNERGENLSDKEILIKEQVYINDEETDSKWVLFAEFPKEKGEKISGYYYFKLFVKGVSGDDCNVYDLKITDQNNSEITASGFLSFSPSLRIENKGDVFQTRFFVNSSTNKITVKTFDYDNARITLSTRTRENVDISPSGDGNEKTFSVNLDEYEKGSECALNFYHTFSKPNDFIVSVCDVSGKAIPLSLPVKKRKFNSLPVMKYNFRYLPDCRSVYFDASASSDNDNNKLTFLWIFEDGKISEGEKIVNSFSEKKVYPVILCVSDNSGCVTNTKISQFEVRLNNPPTANAEENIVSYPGAAIKFDASKSSDTDGKINKYEWNFGDNFQKSGITASYSYKNPGTYNALLIVTDNSDSPCNKDTAYINVKINESPTAVAPASFNISASEEFELDGGKSYDPDGEIIYFKWQFQSGEVKEGKVIKHKFEKPGLQKILLQVKDNDNQKNSFSQAEFFVTVNNPPVASAGKDLLVAADEKFILDAAGSKDADGEIIKYKWLLPDDKTIVGVKNELSFNKPGKYNIKLKVEDNSGTESRFAEDEIEITVNAPPVAKAGNDVKQTFGNVKFDASGSFDPDGEIIKYEWDFGDGAKGNGKSVSHSYNEPGKFNVILKVTDNSSVKNNISFDSASVEINHKPVADAGPDLIYALGDSVKLDASNSFDPDGKITSYTWSISDGTGFSGEKCFYQFQNSGIYKAVLTVKDNSGDKEAEGIDEVKIKVNSAPVIKVEDNFIIAPGEEVVIDASSSYDSDSDRLSFYWLLYEEGKTESSAKIKYKPEKAGINKITLRIDDGEGLRNSVSEITIIVRVNSSPIAEAGDDLYTCSLLNNFDASASSDLDGDALSFKWNFGDGSPEENGILVSHIFKQPGIYPVTLTADDGTGLSNSSSVSLRKIHINHPPVADAQGDIVSCAGEIVLFSGNKCSDTEGGVLKYHWDFGDGTFSDEANPVKIYKNGGIYKVLLKVEDDSGLECNYDYDDVTITVAESPVAFAGEDIVACVNNPIKFDGSKSRDTDGLVNSYLWDFGDGSQGGGATPAHTYTEPGEYNVTLSIFGEQTGSCDNTDTDQLKVTVLQAPACVISAPAVAAINETVLFDGSKSSGENIKSFYWNFNDGSIDSGRSVNHSFNKPGKYNVSLKADTKNNSECSFSVSEHIIVINDAPKAEVKAKSIAKINELITFDASGSSDNDGKITTCIWDFGENEKDTGLIVNHKFSKSGSKFVLLKVIDNTQASNNFAFDTIKVFIEPEKEIKIKGPDKAFTGSNLTYYSVTDENENSVWFVNGEKSQTGKVLNVKFDEAGIHSITLKIRDEKNSEEYNISKEIEIKEIPQAEIITDKNTFCTKEEIIFNIKEEKSEGIKSEYFWKINGEPAGNGNLLGFTSTASGEKTIEAEIIWEVDSVKAKSYSRKDFSVYGLPEAIIISSEKIYIGAINDETIFEALLISGTQNAEFYWDFGDGQKASGKKVKHKFSKPGNYKVELKSESRNGCGSSFTIKNIEVRKAE